MCRLDLIGMPDSRRTYIWNGIMLGLIQLSTSNHGLFLSANISPCLFYSMVLTFPSPLCRRFC